MSKLQAAWLEKFGFESDPYQLSPPWLIPEERIEWNRDDLEGVKREVDGFIKEAVEGHETSLRIWGPWRSGKTWLARYIEKELSKSGKSPFVLKTEVFEYDPSLETFYKRFIDSLLKSDWIQRMSTHISDPQRSDGWRDFFGIEELAKVLCNIYRKDKLVISKEWLMGEKLKSTDMDALEVKTNIDSIYDKFEVFKTIIRKSQQSFSTFVLIIDQLEAAKGRVAEGFSDLLRELLDSFYDKFALVLIFTMDTIDEWYDLNFSQALEYRIKHTVEMGLLKKEYIPLFLRRHHEIYRAKNWKGKDQLFPFNEDSIQYLADRMDAQYMYPNFVLKNCGILAKRLIEKGKPVVTKGIIAEEENLLEYTMRKGK